jgi:hypothetical protein
MISRPSSFHGRRGGTCNPRCEQESVLMHDKPVDTARNPWNDGRAAPGLTSIMTKGPIFRNRAINIIANKIDVPLVDSKSTTADVRSAKWLDQSFRLHPFISIHSSSSISTTEPYTPSSHVLRLCFGFALGIVRATPFIPAAFMIRESINMTTQNVSL